MDNEPPKKQTHRQTKATPVEELAPLPANILDLPSKGQFGYPSSVQYRDILAKDEEVLSTTTAETYARTLNGVLKSVLMNCPFYEQMTIHDRDYALIWLWSNNYSPKRNIEIECSHCHSKEKHMVDMTHLAVTNPVDGFTGSFEMVLKTTGKPVTIKLRTVADEIAVENFMLKNPSTKHDYLMIIRSIDIGVEIPLDQKIKWVGENVTGKEMALIKKFHAHYSYGVKTELEHTCSSCGGVTPFELPFSASEIFDPRLDESDEELLRFM